MKRRRRTIPNYDYLCEKCNLLTEAHRSIDDRDKPLKCKCGGKTTRQIGAPGVIFRGSGFYETDYKQKRGN